MRRYEPIIGQDYSIIGHFDGQYNVPGYPTPNWGPAPGVGPYGPQFLAIGDTGGGADAMPPVPAGMVPAGYPGYGAGFPGYPWWGAAGPVAANLNATASLIAARDSKLIAPNAWSRAYEELLNFPVTTICPGECKTISTKSVPILVKVNNLVIPSAIAPFLLIHGLEMGKWNAFVTSDPAPGEVFIPQASNWLKFSFVTLNPGVQATIEVENTGTAAIKFSGSMFVSAVESC